jgi:hypothetical protein
MLKWMLVAGAAAALGSCAEIREQRAAQDDSKCLGYGATRGSDAYVNCRAQLDAARTGEEAAGAVALSNIRPPSARY